VRKKRKIAEKIYHRLPEGGYLIILENLVDNERRLNTVGLQESLCLGYSGIEGSPHSFEEYKRCLKGAGFKEENIEISKSHLGLSEIILAKK